METTLDVTDESKMNESDKLNSQSNLVVPLKKSVESGQPYFTVSGLGGHVITFQIVDKFVDDGWKGYGVLYPGFLDETQPGDSMPTIEGYADRMLKDVVMTQPKGPYLFVGYSMGGNICLEMARQMKERGEQVGVVLVDVKIYAEAKRKPLLLRLPTQIYWKLRSYYEAFTGQKAKNTLRKREALLYNGENMPRVLPESFDRVIRDGQQAVKNYKLLTTDVPTVLVRCQDMIWYDDNYYWLPDYGWGKYVDLKAVLSSPGDHISMIKPPNATLFAKELKRAFSILLGDQKANSQ